MVDYVRRPSFPARPLLRPRRMVGDHARLVVARHLARRARMDRQLRAHRRRRLVAKPRAMADRGDLRRRPPARPRSEEHTSELQSLMRISYAVFCLKKKKTTSYNPT